MALNIPQLQSSVDAIVARVDNYKSLQRVVLGEDHVPTANAMGQTAVTSGNVTTTMGAQLTTLLAPIRTGIITDANTLTNTLRTDIFGEIAINGGSSPTALIPNKPLDQEFDEDPDNVSAWLRSLFDFLVRVNNIFG